MPLQLPNVYVEISGNFSKLEQAFDDVKVIVARDATGISNALNNALSPKQIENSVMGLVRNLQKVSSASKIAGDSFDKIGVDLGELRKITGMTERDFASLQSRMLQTRVTQQAERSFQSIAKAANLTGAEMVALRRNMGDLDGAARLQKQLWGESVANGFSTARAAAMGMMGAIATLVGLGYTLKSAFDAALRFERLEKAYETITGSSQAAKAQLQYLYETSDRLGLQFQDTAEAAKSLFAAGKGTDVEKDLRAIFEGVAQASVSMALTSDQTNGALLAIGQMISKGKVQAEELRSQLAERLPGAFQIFARAIGVSTAELDKMLEQGKVGIDNLRAFGEQLKIEFPNGASKAQRSVNELSTEWERFKTSVSQTDTIVSAMNVISNALKDMTNEMGKTAQLAPIIKEMRAAGIQPDSIGFNPMGILTPSRGITPKYSDAAITSFTNRKQAVNDLGSVNRERREDKLAREAELARAQVLDRAASTAKMAATGFLKETDDSKTEKIVNEAKDAIEKLQKVRALDVANAAKYDAQITAIETERGRKIAALHKDEVASSDKVATARAALSEKLAKMQDTGTEGDSRIASLTKEYDDFSKKLGTADVQVRALAESLAYAKGHYGHTQAEVAKSTRAVAENVAVLENEISALEQSRDAYGNINQQRLSVLTVTSQAEQEYQKRLLEGIDAGIAARERDLKMQRAQMDATQQNLQLQRDFYGQYADMFNDSGMKSDAINRQMAVYGSVSGIDPAMVEKMRNRKLLEARLEPKAQAAQSKIDYADLTNDAQAYYAAQIDQLNIQKELAQTEEERALIVQRLSRVQAQANGDFVYAARDALAEYKRNATDTFTQVGQIVGNSMKSMEDAIVSFGMTGKFSFADFTNSVISDMMRMAAQKSVTGPLAGVASGALTSMVGGGGGIFSFLGKFFHDGGVIGHDAPTFTRPVNPAIFDGAPRFHTGLLPTEFPAILEKGETVIPKDGFNFAPVKAGGGGVTVNVYNNSGSVQARTMQRPNMGGGMDIDVIIDEIDRAIADGIKSGTNHTGAALEKTYGTTRAGGLY